MNRFVLVFVLLSAVVIAQGQSPTGGRPHPGTQGSRITTATRAVTKYSAQERQLQEALRTKDASTIERTLSDDFEVWSGERDAPTPRTDWIAAHNGTQADVQIRNMAVREFGDTAVVSFMLESHASPKGRPVPHAMFIVDVWRQGENKLAVRYECVPAGVPKTHLQPTGKE